jgi:sialic acid synthase SpsE
MKIAIGDRLVGPGKPMYIIAEAGANHDGELKKAKRLIDAADEANADAVKFQNYTAEKLVTQSAKKWWADTSTTQYETYSKLDTLTREENFEMAEYASDTDIPFLSTPFDEEAVDLLEKLGVPAYKIASGDLTHHPLLKYVAELGKPIILSTGMSTLEEVREAVDVIESAGNSQIVLLHCISAYPTPVEDINLGMMQTLMNEFDYPVGLSDHTEGVTVPIAAAAMGAAVLEKHFTYDKTLDKSPDHRLSADVQEMQEIVDRTRDVHAAVGRSMKEPVDIEMETREKARRSLVTVRALEAGDPIDQDDLGVKRPGTGIAPKHLDDVDSWEAATDLKDDQTLTWDDVIVE